MPDKGRTLPDTIHVSLDITKLISGIQHKSIIHACSPFLCLNDYIGSERCSVATILTHRSITWERLAKALKRIEGYEFAADKIRAECTGNSTMLSKINVHAHVVQLSTISFGMHACMHTMLGSCAG